MNLFRSRQSSLAREAQADNAKKVLGSEAFAKAEEKMIRTIEGFRLSRAQRRQGIKLYREGAFPAKRTFGQWIKQFMPPPGVFGADGLFYHDTRAPFMAADPANDVTLATTAKALYPAGSFPSLGGQYWNLVGKKMKIRLFGKITTAATPGNGSFDIYYGTGADANGVLLASSGALALQANQATLSWVMEVEITCVSTGAAGTLFVTGWALFNVAVLLSTVQPMLIPPSAAVVSGACDLTAANIISVQFKRSGNTAEHMWAQQMGVVAMN